MDWSTEPALTQTWANFLTALRTRDDNNAKMDYTGDTNLPTGTIRWNTSTSNFERWNGSAWGTLNLVYTARTVSAGAGLTGGGDLSANRTIAMANMAQSTIKGRAAGAGTGEPTDLTPAQVVAMLLSADGAGSGLDADLLDGNHASAFALASHNHAASAITSGTVAAARLGSGTPGSGNFLRGDSSWQALSFSTLSGSIANGQVPASAVTQHVGSINHNSLLNYNAARHYLITVSTSAASGGANTDIHLRYT